MLGRPPSRGPAPSLRTAALLVGRGNASGGDVAPPGAVPGCIASAPWSRSRLADGRPPGRPGRRVWWWRCLPGTSYWVADHRPGPLLPPNGGAHMVDSSLVRPSGRAPPPRPRQAPMLVRWGCGALRAWGWPGAPGGGCSLSAACPLARGADHATQGAGCVVALGRPPSRGPALSPRTAALLVGRGSASGGDGVSPGAVPGCVAPAPWSRSRPADGRPPGRSGRRFWWRRCLPGRCTGLLTAGPVRTCSRTAVPRRWIVCRFVRRVAPPLRGQAGHRRPSGGGRWRVVGVGWPGASDGGCLLSAVRLLARGADDPTQGAGCVVALGRPLPRGPALCPRTAALLVGRGSASGGDGVSSGAAPGCVPPAHPPPASGRRWP